MKFMSQTGEIENYCRDQIQANGQSDDRRDDEQRHRPGRITDRLLQQFVHSRQPGQSRDIETQIHDLDQEEKHANILASNCWYILWSGEHRDRRRRFRGRRLPGDVDRCGGDHGRRWWASERSLLFNKLNRSEKSISPARQSLDESRVSRRVTQGFAQLIDYGIEAMIKIDKCICRPKFLSQLFPRDYFAWPLQQHQKDLKWLLLHTQAQARLAQFSRAGVHLVGAESKDSIRASGRHRNHLNPERFLCTVICS